MEEQSMIRVVRRALVFWWFMIPSVVAAQTVAMGRADSAFSRKDWQTAAALYREIVRVEDANGAAWFRLGASLESAHKLRDAAAAYERAAALSFQKLGSEFRLARVYAQLNDTKQAFAHLRQAAALGFPPAFADNEPTLASLRTLPEYNEVRAIAEAAQYPCRSVHTFDFWVGDFDTSPWSQPGAPPTGRLHNTRAYEGCVIVEEFTSPGSSGMSMAFYDVNRRAWRMVWNDDRNSSNDFEGEYRDGTMRFHGWVLDSNGRRILATNTLINVAPDTIRHIYAISPDSGKTWNVMSDGRFVRRHP
jgi:hypothetical protein